MSPWVWRRGSRIVYIEELDDGSVRVLELEPSPSEMEREARLRERQAKASRGWPLSSHPGGREEARRRWRKTVLEHEVEKRALREGRGGHDE